MFNNNHDYYTLAKQQLGSQQFNYHFNISLKNNYIYCEVSKAGCTGIKKQLIRNEFNFEGIPKQVQKRHEYPHKPIDQAVFIKPFQVGEAIFNRMMRDSRVFKFALVRNPYTRALSGYLDKILRGKEQKKNIAPHVAAQRSCTLDDFRAKDITFLEFCKALAGKDNIREFDHHWRPQAAHICIDIVPYSFIGKLENIDSDLKEINKHIGSLSNTNETGHKTGAGQRLKDFYCEESMEIIANVYEEDFERFNYDIQRLPV